MFGWEFPPVHSGGLGVACEGLVNGLLKHNVRVTLVLPHNQAKKGENFDVRFPTEEMYRSIEVESNLLAYDDFLSYQERMHAGTMPCNVQELYGPDLGSAVHLYTEKSIEMTKDVHADVIHTHDWMTYEAGCRASKHHDIPMVAHVHATELDRTDFQPNPWIAQRERSGLQKAHKVIAVSNYTKGLLTNHYGIAEDKISVVHNGHDTDMATATMRKVRRNNNDPMVMFLGRMTIQKNPWQFLEAAHRILQVQSNIKFVMAGGGSMLDELINRACELGIQDSVLFAGKVSQQEVKELFARADCFVMPSLSEPFGLVALEAISHGVPVVLSRQSGASEVIEHGFKVDFWDTDKMADCILTILREEPLAHQLRSEAPRVLQRLNWHNQAGVVHSIYKNITQS